MIGAVLDARSIGALRRMFEERGRHTELVFGKPNARVALRVDGCDADILIDNMSEGLNRFAICNLTPEQVIEATLGRGTCRRVLYKPTNVLVCSECGAGMPKQLDKYCYLHYCPNCGRKVVDA